MSEHAFTNLLLHETGPYLLQHAHNPVDWYPWGPEALERARTLDRPIFLSIGYSACHWCHVMARESFEDPAIGAFLNEHFVSIKVDREERPDLDQIYMTAVQLLTRQGGWPMSVFLTPSLKPFYGGTYFPPEDAHGRPSFRRLLESLAEACKNRRGEVDGSADNITEHLQQANALEVSDDALNDKLLTGASTALSRGYDHVHGGFGGAPKFPHALELQLLLRIWQRTDEEAALDMACHTLEQMARGGIYDHLGGGFHRYSTDERWLAPHFEKMLYDNALLSQAYLEAFQATGKAEFRTVVVETLDYVLREMTSPEGGFYSTQDADSEGEEGKFFVWSYEEVESILGPERMKAFSYVYDVNPEGNWEEKTILHRTKTAEQEARLLGMDASELAELLAASRHELLAVRSKRIWPGRDEKILTAWNGLMLNSMAQAAGVLGEPRYEHAAQRVASFLIERMRGTDGRLLRTYKSGSSPKLNAYLEDYAFVINALVSVYELDFDLKWLQSATELAEVMIEEFWDEAAGGFYFTGKSHESLITRNKDLHDSSTPSGNSVAVMGLLRLAKLTGRAEFHDKAVATMRLFAGLMTRSPNVAAQMLICLDFELGPVQEFAVLGQRSAPEVLEALQTIRKRFLPRKIVAWAADESTASASMLPVLEGKKPLGPVTTYICKNFACQEPVIDVAGLAAALDAAPEH
ncbi:thioredoxin domain-containing protein [soil metagenome]